MANPGFEIYEHTTVLNLTVHFENDQHVYLTEDTARNIDGYTPERKLTVFLKLSQH